MLHRDDDEELDDDEEESDVAPITILLIPT